MSTSSKLTLNINLSVPVTMAAGHVDEDIQLRAEDDEFAGDIVDGEKCMSWDVTLMCEYSSIALQLHSVLSRLFDFIFHLLIDALDTLKSKVTVKKGRGFEGRCRWCAFIRITQHTYTSVHITCITNHRCWWWSSR